MAKLEVEICVVGCGPTARSQRPVRGCVDVRMLLCRVVQPYTIAAYSIVASFFSASRLPYSSNIGVLNPMDPNRRHLIYPCNKQSKQQQCCIVNLPD